MRSDRLTEFFSEQIKEALSHHLGPQMGIPDLIKRFETEFISLQDLESLGILAIRSGYHCEFVQLCLKKLDENAEIPWAHFSECVQKWSKNIPGSIKRSIYNGAETQKLLEHLCRTHGMDDMYSDLPQIRRERRTQWGEKHHFQKKELLAQVEMLRTQELDQDEERVLRKLQRMFPKDQAILKLIDEQKERKALHLLDARVRKPESHWERTEKPDLAPEEKDVATAIIQSMLRILKKSPELRKDFAVALLTWDFPEGALEVLEKSKRLRRRTKSEVWLMMEAMLQARRFVALLTLINDTETSPNLEPDDVFGLLYLKARAYWGLGNKFSAIEILENIVNHRPTYRSAITLLRLWKDGGNP